MPHASPLETTTAIQETIQDALYDFPAFDEYDYVLTAAGSGRRGTSVEGASDADFILSIPANDHVSLARRYEQWVAFRDTARDALTKLRPKTIMQAAKCIDIEHPEYPQPIDVTPCLRHPTGVIEFWTSTRTPNHILSFPDQHLERLDGADMVTAGATRSLARVVKSHKNTLIAQDTLDPKTAPSYMLESSVMSMLAHLFTGDPNQDLRNYIAFMQGALDGKNPIPLQHGSGHAPLIGTNPNTDWRIKDARTYITQLFETTA